MTYGTLMVSGHSAFTNAARWFQEGMISAERSLCGSGCGIDFVFIDTEHVPLDRDELSKMCLAYTALGITLPVAVVACR